MATGPLDTQSREGVALLRREKFAVTDGCIYKSTSCGLRRRYVSKLGRYIVINFYDKQNTPITLTRFIITGRSLERYELSNGDCKDARLSYRLSL
jgi:hypothetical protein